jgi:GNAT superfamily N-acetyltransferase
MMPDVRPLTPDRLGDLAELFATNGTCEGCWCTWYLVSSREFSAGYGAVNRERFTALATASPTPLGVLAYRDGHPVGWCAVGPRSRYARSLRSPLLARRDRAEDADVWLVTCFFVRRDARRSGVTADLLTAAVDLAAGYGARAVEAVPLVAGRRRAAAEAYMGSEPTFAACGFEVRDRPSPLRVVMRRELAPPA